MRRRELLAAFFAVLGSHAAFAQSPAKIRRVGVLMGIANDAEGQLRVAALLGGLKDLGWTEGSNIQVDVRWAEGDVLRARGLAAELVALEPSVLVGNSAPVISALREVTSVLPIVFVQVNDPIGQGLIKSLAKPGANVTGFLNFEPAIAGKWLALLKEISPGIAKVGVVFNKETVARGAGGAVHIPLLQAAVPGLGIRVMPMPSNNLGEIEHVKLRDHRAA